MVLEHLFPEKWLERKFPFAFLLGLLYSIIGIVLASVLFGATSGLASVAFTALLLIPSLRKLFAAEEKLEEKEKRFSLKALYYDNKQLFHIYTGMFFGVFFGYYSTTLAGAYVGVDVISIFEQQIFLDPVISGRATDTLGLFWRIVENNWIVVLACFLLSFISGNGATFFVTWNASAWAVIFALRAFAASQVLETSTVLTGFAIKFMTFPHVFLEGGAYIMAGIAGAVMSRDIVNDAKDLKKLVFQVVGLLLIFFLGNWFLKFLFFGPLLTLSQMLLIVLLLYQVKDGFHTKKHQEVFLYNYWLFVIAIAVFLIGAFVESLVLSHMPLLSEYYSAAANYFGL